MFDQSIHSSEAPLSVGIADDYGGYALKEHLAVKLREVGHAVSDFGDDPPKEDDDFPDFITMNPNTFFMEPLPPFRLDLTVWTLRRRPENVMDRWDGMTYRRVLTLPTGIVEVAVIQVGSPESPQLKVLVNGQPLRASVKAAVISALEQLLGLRIDLSGFYRLASRDELLGELAGRFLGMRPSCYATVFESVVVGIASQQVSRTMSILLLNRLTAKHGPSFRAGDVITHAFPRAQDLAELRPSELRPLGFSSQKERAIRELAQSVAAGSLDLEGLARLPDEEAITRLCALRGVGRWTAGYVLLRGMGRIHIFPGDETGVRDNLKRWLHLKQPPDHENVRHTLETWHPYAGLIYFYMLLARLADAGLLPTEPPQARSRQDQPRRYKSIT